MDFKEYQEKAETTAMYDQKLLKRIEKNMMDIFDSYLNDEGGDIPDNDVEKAAADIAIQVQEQIIMGTLIPLMRLSYVGLGMGEVGEVQGKLKKIIRDSGGVVTDDKKEAIKGELGDILWYVAAACKELNLSMDDVAQANIDKLFSRKERGVITGSGDNR